MSLSETYLSRKKLLADNLKSMGVSSVNETDGLTTLINAVLDIEPSIGGLDLDTSLVITTTQEIIGLGESIILTSTLRASYDDTTVVDVDLSGVLTGATVKFYNGTTLLGTAITDLNGVATYTYTPSQLGNFTFHTVFEGTENFTNCTSNNVNITVINAPTSLVLEADKSILSHYDNDNCTLTATLYDNNNTPMEGLSVVFKNGDIVLDTITTDSGGVATYTYNSQGVGDVTITAKCMNLVQIYAVEDCIFYHPDEVSITSNTSSDVIEKRLTDYIFTDLPVNFELSYDYKTTRCGGRIQLGSNANTSSSIANYQIGMGTTGSCKRTSMARATSTDATESGTISTNTYYNCRMVKNGNSIQYYWDDVLHTIKTVSWFENHHDYVFVYGIWAVATMTGKNFKIKPLQ